MIATVYFLTSQEAAQKLMAKMDVDETYLFVRGESGLATRVTYHGQEKGWDVEFLHNVLVIAPDNDAVVPIAELVDGMQIQLVEQDEEPKLH